MYVNMRKCNVYKGHRHAPELSLPSRSLKLHLPQKTAPKKKK